MTALELNTRAVRSSKGITYTVLEHVDRSWKFERFVREQTPISVAAGRVALT